MVSSIENYQIFLFDPLMGPQQLQPRWDRVDLGVMAIKGYSTFAKASGLEPHNHIVISKTLIGVGCGSLPSAEMQSLYSTTPANWAYPMGNFFFFFFF